MILQALCRYYDALIRKGKAPVEGYAKEKCTFCVVLGDGGNVMGMIPFADDRNEYIIMTVPRPYERTSGVKSSFLFGNAEYVFGMDVKGAPKHTIECAKDFQQLHHTILDGCNSDAARAVLAFVDTPNRGAGEALSNIREELSKGGKIVFSYRGIYVHDDPAVRDAWDRYYHAQPPGREMICLVTGEKRPIATGHDKVKGVQDTLMTGANLVAFNDYDAAESYGLKGYENSPISEKASFAFTTALKELLADRKHKCHMGGATIVYWAEGADLDAQDFLAFLMQAPIDADEELHAVMDDLRAGRPVGDFSLDTPFYVLALSPNAARMSVRFFLQNTLGELAHHLQMHYDRLQIVHGPKESEYLKPWQLLQELERKKSRDKSPPPPPSTIAGSYLRSILTGSHYPKELLGAVILRIRSDQNVSYAKAAMVKAYLLQHYPMTKEDIDVALNQTTDCKPYVLGRLFSLLERIQKEAAITELKTTIKDRYLASASASPGMVFPTLLRLQSAHMNKLSAGAQVYYGKLLGATLGKLDVEQEPFPAQLKLDEQGLFFLGYYQQDQAWYEKKEDKKNG